jgi:predicted dehydrogenase
MPARATDPAPFRAVFVGCGEISAWWFRPLSNHPEVRIVGIVDLNEAAADGRRAEFSPDARIGTDLAAMLEELRPDLVFDCTIPAARAQVVETALRHGCHVLSEKPMANSMEEARRLLKVARETGRTFAVMQNRRYQGAIRSLRTFLEDRTLGRLTTLNSDFYIGAHFGGYRAAMKHTLLLDMAIHTFDQARFLSGADPVSVYCREWNPEGSWFAHGASAAAIFEMSNGLVYTYRGSWCGEGLATTWECDWRAIGTGGTALWDGAGNFRAERPVPRDAANAGPAGELVRPGETVTVPAADWPGPEGHAGCIHPFLDALRAGRVPETGCADNIRSLAMVFGAIESAESGQAVKIQF